MNNKRKKLILVIYIFGFPVIGVFAGMSLYYVNTLLFENTNDMPIEVLIVLGLFLGQCTGFVNARDMLNDTESQGNEDN